MNAEAKSYLLSKVKTPRLVFRKVTLDDMEEWMQFFRSEEALKFLPFKLNSPKACQEWIERQLLRYKETKSGLYALIEKTSGQMVGQCGLLTQEVDGENELEIGYHLIPKFWKKGFATEAASACKNYAFKNNLAGSLISIIHIENINSQKVAERNGMRREKTANFKGFPVFIYRIKKEDWI